MSEAVNAISGAIEKLYHGFILRDLLGFALPGLISMYSLWYRFEPDFSNNDFVNQIKGTQVDNWVKPIALLVTAYLTGWILQCLHYGIIDWLFQIGRRFDKAKLEQLEQHKNLRIIWPIVGVLVYLVKVANFNTPSDEIPPSLISRGALAPDNAYKKYQVGLPVIVSQYPERLSALMLMTGNLAISGTILLFALPLNWCYWWGGLAIILFLYLEYWRLWYTRNLQIQMHVESLRKIKAEFE